MFSKLNSEEYAEEILEYFQSEVYDSSKKIINLEIIYECHSNDYSYEKNSISFKIGDKRLYTVKNARDFIESIQSEVKIFYGQSFTLNTAIQKFPDKKEKVIDIMKELIEMEDVSSFSFHSLFNRKKIYMTNSLTSKIFEILEDEKITLIIDGSVYNNIKITCDNLPIKLNLEDSNDNGFSLNIINVNKYIPLTDDCSCFFYENTIYKINTLQQKSLKPFSDIFKWNIKNIYFKPSQKAQFFSETLPAIENNLDIKISQQVKSNIIKEELYAKIYLDSIEDIVTAKDIITAQVKFIYGVYEINPFNVSINICEDAKVLIRNISKENSIIAIFENSDFLVNKDYLYIDSDDKIFAFIYETLPLLQEVAEIYYSDSFCKMKVSDNRKFSVGVRLSGSTLQMNIDYGDIPSSELKDIFYSYRIKKKYHKLKDGSFVPLDNQSLENLSDMIEYMNISDKVLAKETISLSMNRAMYLNNSLSQNEDIQFNTSDEFKKFVDNISHPTSMDFDPPNGLSKALRSYQITGFKWLKTLAYYGLGGILADDMGLGKTLQTIAFVLSERNGIPSIVICPTSLVYNWLDEINKFAPQLNSLLICGTQSTRQELLQDIENKDLIITSYALIRRDIELYNHIEFKYCFIDEAQNIKNPDSINAKAVKQIKAKSYFALTGTPIENSLTEMWSIFDFVMKGYLLSHAKFLKKYEKPIVKENDKKSLQELNKQIQPFIMRRMKKEVLKELPEKIETKMSAEMTDEQNKAYLAYMNYIQTELSKEIGDKGYNKSQIKILAALTRLRQICCHPAMFIENYNGESGKMILLMQILEDAIPNGHRILIFSQFTSMLKIIIQSLDINHINYFYLDGSTKSELRGEYVKRFNEGEREIFLISLKAGGTGLNLTGADTVIHFDPWWNPAVEEQATDRAYRIGQNNSVQVMKLITKGTIEEKIYQLQDKKRELINCVIQPGETFINKMSESEIKSLFDM